jgi:ELWxxDGT repeat protein
MGKVVLFSANDGIHGDELWITDGTSAGTQMVKDIRPPNTNTLGDPNYDGSEPKFFAQMDDGRILFQAKDDEYRRTELWITDGTEEGTNLFMDLDEYSSAEPEYLTALGNGRIVFSYDDPFNTGRELWVTDGTVGGTQLLKDINPSLTFPRSSDPEYFKAVGEDRVIFIADDKIHGKELWVTDGTAAGTQLLRDITPGSDGSEFLSNPSYVDSLAAWTLPGDRIALRVYGEDGYRIWVTDGTQEGTVMLGGGGSRRLLLGCSGRQFVDQRDQCGRRSVRYLHLGWHTGRHPPL